MTTEPAESSVPTTAELIDWSSDERSAKPLAARSVASLRHELRQYVDHGYGDHAYAETLRAEIERR